LKFSDALLKKIESDVDAQHREIPKIGSFLEIHALPACLRKRGCSRQRLNPEQWGRYSCPGTPQLKIALMLKWFKQNLLALSREILIDKAAARD